MAIDLASGLDVHASRYFSQPPDFPVLQQGGVRYRWDGEEIYGMIERSSPQDKITL